MDIQLQALQNIADNMEKDFSNTKLVCSDCFVFFSFFQLKLEFTFWNDFFVYFKKERIMDCPFTLSAGSLGFHCYCQRAKSSVDINCPSSVQLRSWPSMFRYPRILWILKANFYRRGRRPLFGKFQKILGNYNCSFSYRLTE